MAVGRRGRGEGARSAESAEATPAEHARNAAALPAHTCVMDMCTPMASEPSIMPAAAGGGGGQHGGLWVGWRQMRMGAAAEPLYWTGS